MANALRSTEAVAESKAARGVEVKSPSGQIDREYLDILEPEALEFAANLHREFNSEREALLRERHKRQAHLDAGLLPGFLRETEAIRKTQWSVAPAPRDFQDRRVEITGPAERKMMINGLNSGASVFMADLEDSLSPTWDNVVRAQLNLRDAVRRKLTFESPEGKKYVLNENPATLVMRPRGWHLEEKHVLVDGSPISASLFDFAMYFYHNAHELVRRGSGPYFYLPKLESHLEARLWNSVFEEAQRTLGIPSGTIRATVLIETIFGAFEMDEILYELRHHAAGLNAGRWDYLFSIIKRFRHHPGCVLPDRAVLTMDVPFMHAYAELLVKTAHRRGAHAIGGMAAYIPSRKDAHVNETALAKIREDKEREARAGFDGTWVAHPDLVGVAREIFDRALDGRCDQKHLDRDDVHVSPSDLLDFRVSGAKISENGFRNNVNVAIRYLERWLAGQGAVAINNLMEDAATAEIARAQLWQWVRHNSRLESGVIADRDYYSRVRHEELARLDSDARGRFDEAAALLDALVLHTDFTEFLTIPGYQRGIA